MIKVDKVKIAYIKKILLQNNFKFVKLELEANINEGNDGHPSFGALRDLFTEKFKIYLTDKKFKFKNMTGGEAYSKIVKYANFYHDGSVSHELTITIRTETIELMPAICQIFHEMCGDLGRVEYKNAGVHIALMEGYNYEHYAQNHKLNPIKLDHFRNEVSKLLLAITYLGSPNMQTRSFQYRQLRIGHDFYLGRNFSPDNDSKCSAIYTHNGTMFEFRVFDPVPGNENYILNDIYLIAKLLRYYTEDENVTVPLKESIPRSRIGKIANITTDAGYVREFQQIFDQGAGILRLLLELYCIVPKIVKTKINKLKDMWINGRISQEEILRALK